MASAELLDIGEVARRSGLATSALRYYEQQGFIASVARNGLRRQYAPDVLSRLAVVRLAREAGFSISETKALLETKGRAREWKQLARRKSDDLAEQIARLERLRDHLEHALECPSPNLFDCEHLRASLAQMVARGQAQV